MKELINRIFNIGNDIEFEELSLKVFYFQYENNKVYKTWCKLMKVEPSQVKSISQIPFLPISFFKTHDVVSFNKEDSVHFFKSSGTTGLQTSKHYIYDLGIYERSFVKCFEEFFSRVEDYCFIALLPNYLEQGNSSLVYMIDNLIKKSKYRESGFYKDSLQDVIQKLKVLEEKNTKTILFGVTYALLDLIEIEKLSLKNTIVFETGGMKGRRKEIIREELHEVLCEGFSIDSIASEYGMSELFSQAYSKSNGIFFCPKHMKVMIRDTYDPLSYIGNNKTGGINVIDLANIYSCSFIETEDLGKIFWDNSFELLGRIDNTTTRGCNLMYEF
ncbi:MAG: acyltransferase [Bacteroidales bacterium]|nr:acyltransferase [Bacteroidales bacterium]MDD4683825.1 acyltransferase [Bacteroidales bacterium]